MSEPFDITSDSELRDAVRAETQYDEGKVSQSDMEDLVDSAKRDLALRTGVTNFDYSDRGVSVALLGLVCAKAKGAVENSPVVVKDLGGQNVTFRASDGESLQLEQYERMVQRGLSNSNQTSAGVQGIEFTRDWLNDNRGL